MERSDATTRERERARDEALLHRCQVLVRKIDTFSYRDVMEHPLIRKLFFPLRYQPSERKYSALFEVVGGARKMISRSVTDSIIWINM